MESINKYDKVMSDHNLFNEKVYTPISEALHLLEERQNDPILMAKITKLLHNNIPDVCKNKKCGIMARQLATPNHENRTFISLAKENDLHPVFLEYFDDKFTSNNKYKHSLGQLHIKDKVNISKNECLEKITIIDFNKSNGKKLKEVKTLWGEPLVDFHKKLFDIYKIKDFSFFEEAQWYEKKGEKPIDFYVNFFLLVTCYGILFENFLLLKDDSEGQFTRDVVLPALDKVVKLTGVKPLIVPLESIDSETEEFWYYHLPIIKNQIKNNPK